MNSSGSSASLAILSSPCCPASNSTTRCPGVVADDLQATEKERLTRIHDESFYGQEQIRLPEVEAALQQTYRTVGAPDEIQSFVLSALNQFNARATRQPDDTWKLDLRGTTFNDLGNELHITFDPKIARDDDQDLDLLDLAHPLVLHGSSRACNMFSRAPRPPVGAQPKR